VGGQNQQSVEPTTGLVNTLGDEIGRECLLEELFVFEWVVELGIWHTIDSKVIRITSLIISARAYLPDSNQQSNTSSTRLKTPLPF
jgi:hypothetical protein